MVLGQAGALVAVGVALGGVLALVASAPVRSLLFGLEANMAPLLVIAAGVLAATGALASYVPARRAARLEPQTALTLE
jgi:ABC-type antimicrobial peptide transport system permease subunit